MGIIKHTYTEDRNGFNHFLQGARFSQEYKQNFINYLRGKLEYLQDEETDIDEKKRKHDIKETEDYIDLLENSDYIVDDAIAYITDVSVSTVKRWKTVEGAKIAYPNSQQLIVLANAFGVTVNAMLEETTLNDYVYKETVDGNYEHLIEQGVDVEKLRKIYDGKCGNDGEFSLVLDGLNYLFAEKEEPFSVLKKLALYLMDAKFNMDYCYSMNDISDFSSSILNYSHSGLSIEECLKEIRNRLDSLPKNIRSSENDNYDALCRALQKYKEELKKK